MQNYHQDSEWGVYNAVFGYGMNIVYCCPIRKQDSVQWEVLLSKKSLDDKCSKKGKLRVTRRVASSPCPLRSMATTLQLIRAQITDWRWRPKRSVHYAKTNKETRNSNIIQDQLNMYRLEKIHIHRHKQSYAVQAKNTAMKTVLTPTYFTVGPHCPSQNNKSLVLTAACFTSSPIHACSFTCHWLRAYHLLRSSRILTVISAQTDKQRTPSRLYGEKRVTHCEHGPWEGRMPTTM